MGSFVCIINLLVALIFNVLMRLSCQGKGTEGLRRVYEVTFFKTRNYHREKPYLCLVTRSYSDKVVLRRIQYFMT